MPDAIPPASPDGTAPPAPPVSDPADVEVKLTPAQLKTRLDERAASAREAFLKELGLPSLAEGKKALEAAKKLREEQMTEQERLQTRVKELEPFEARAKAAEERYAKFIQKQFDALPENVRAAIDEQLGDEATPEQRERLMAFHAKVGGSQTSGDAQSAAQSANQTKPANAGATPPAPRPATVKSKFDQWVDLEARDPIGASIFFNAHSQEIERTRPA